MESVFENFHDGVMTIDAARKITAFNAAMESLTGYAREEVVGKECSVVLELRGGEGTSPCSTQCPLSLASKESGQLFEQQGSIRIKDMRRINVNLLYSVARSPRGRPTSAVAIVREESASRQVDALSETFLAMLGHELQTPLSIIKGYASTLVRRTVERNDDLLSQGLKVIEEECDHLSRMVNKLLFASRISTGTATLEKEAINMAGLVRRVVYRLKRLSGNHTFETRFARDFPPVVADPGLMEQVVSNLVENAIKYSPQGGKIKISGSWENGLARIIVSDEGVGIPADRMEHLFTRFDGVQDGRMRLAKGTGLGLYICKAIIEAHKGTIEATSQPRKGSQFTFSLPVEEDT
ncbi:MAG: PAS domain-containing protein [Chloroflexi bacterium]|nr:PAS domain-containing protein [Chloroflexota bacterium]